MTPEVAVDLFREALWLTTMMVAVLVVPSLLVGLLVAMFQAATQINESTLSFIPKVIGVCVVLVLVGPLIMEMLVDYTRALFSSLPTLIG